MEESNPIVIILYLALIVVAIVAQWKVFEKAGEPGWACIVPIYNIIVMLNIAKKPTWWIILLLVPFVNIIMILIIYISLAKQFGKGVGFGVGLAFLGFIFFPILGFGDAVYQDGTKELLDSEMEGFGASEE